MSSAACVTLSFGRRPSATPLSARNSEPLWRSTSRGRSGLGTPQRSTCWMPTSQLGSTCRSPQPTIDHCSGDLLRDPPRRGRPALVRPVASRTIAFDVRGARLARSPRRRCARPEPARGAPLRTAGSALEQASVRRVPRRARAYRKRPGALRCRVHGKLYILTSGGPGASGARVRCLTNEGMRTRPCRASAVPKSRVCGLDGNRLYTRPTG
jgi:hypothetical protein